MSKARLRKAEAILSKLRAKDTPALSNVIIYADEADRDRQLAAWKEKGGKGTVILLPCKELLAGTSYAEPDTEETPTPAGAGDSAPA